MIIYILIYAIISVSGVVCVKLGGSEYLQFCLSKNSIRIETSWLTLAGMVLYIISFLIYMGLISKNQLSYVVPMATAIVYVLTLVSAYIVFKEQLTIYQIIGCAMIIIGALLVGSK